MHFWLKKLSSLSARIVSFFSLADEPFALFTVSIFCRRRRRLPLLSAHTSASTVRNSHNFSCVLFFRKMNTTFASFTRLIYQDFRFCVAAGVFIILESSFTNVYRCVCFFRFLPFFPVSSFQQFVHAVYHFVRLDFKAIDLCSL